MALILIYNLSLECGFRKFCKSLGRQSSLKSITVVNHKSRLLLKSYYEQVYHMTELMCYQTTNRKAHKLCKNLTVPQHTQNTHFTYNLVRSFSLAGRDNSRQTAWHCILVPEVWLRTFECQRVGMYVFTVISWGEGYQRGGMGGAHLNSGHVFSSGEFFLQRYFWVSRTDSKIHLLNPYMGI